MSPYHICIFTQSPLVRAPRVVKEANTYAKAGYKVTVYAIWYDAELLEADRRLLEANISYKAGVNLLDWDCVASRIIRFRRLIFRNLIKYFNIQSRNALGYDYSNYFKKIAREKADLYIGHEEMSMALAKALIQNGHKVAFDFEDWHSKDLLPTDQMYRPIKLLEQLENFLLQNAAYCYTTSEAMAKAMADFHQAPQPKVVYNSFLVADRKLMDHDRKDIKQHHTPSVVWFSQVVGPGRGLELLFEALPMVKTSFQLHLRGRIDAHYKKELYNKTPKHIELYIHEVVAPEALISRIAEHDLGIAFEETQPESRNYTITNKVFHYLQAGIPILATETAGQLEVAQKASQAIRLIERSPVQVAKALDAILGNPHKIEQMKAASWKAGSDVFAFDSMGDRLLKFLQSQSSS